MNTFQNINAMTVNQTNAGLTVGTGVNYTTTLTTSCVIRGKFAVTLAAQTNTALPTLDVTSGVAFPALVGASTYGQGTVFVYGTNVAGVIKVAQGSIVNTELGITTVAGNWLNEPLWPALPDDFCPIAYQLVRTSPTLTSFQFGVTSMAASGVNVVTVNVHTLPDRPLLA